MSRTSIQSALDRISGSTQKERTSGYGDLKRILRNGQGNARELLKIRIHPGQDVLEAIASLVDSEKAAYLKPKKATTGSAQSSIANRLAAISSTYRLAIEVFASEIKLKRVRELLEHLTGLYADGSDGVCEPVALDCTKAMNQILAFRPHLDHLPSPEWSDICKFAIVQFKNLKKDLANASSKTAWTAPRDTSLSMRSSDASASTSQTTNMSTSLGRHLLSEIAGILRHLTSSAKAPIVAQAAPILKHALDYLNNAGAAGASEVEVVGIINNVLLHTNTEVSTLIQNLVPMTMPVIDRLWSKLPPRLTALEDGLLALMIQMLPFLEASIVHSDQDGETAQVSEAITDRLVRGYCDRAYKDILLAEDIRLFSPSIDSAFQFPAFSLSTRNETAERNWTILRLISRLIDCISIQPRPSTDTHAQNGPRLHKRARHETKCSRLTRLVKEPGPSRTIAGLQLIAFHLQETRLSAEDLDEVMTHLLSHLTNDNPIVVFWAAFACSSCTYQDLAMCSELRGTWAKVWISARRSLGLTAASRTSSQLLTNIASRGLVEHKHINEFADSLRRSSDIRGPPLCDEASLALYIIMLDFAQIHRPGIFGELAESALDWMMRTWDPGQSTAADAGGKVQGVSNLQVVDLANLFSTIMQDGIFLDINLQTPPTSALACSWQHQKTTQAVLQYLLRLDKSERQNHRFERRRSKFAAKYRDGGPESIKSSITNALEKHLARVRDSWGLHHEQNFANVDVDTVKSSATLVYLAQCVKSRVVINSGFSRQSVSSIMSSMLDHLATPDCHLSKRHAALDVLLQPIKHVSGGDSQLIIFESEWYSCMYTVLPQNNLPDASQDQLSDLDVSMSNGFDFDDSPRIGSLGKSRDPSQTNPVDGNSDLENSATRRFVAKLLSGLGAGGSDCLVAFEYEFESSSAEEKIAASNVLLSLKDLRITISETSAATLLVELSDQVLSKSYTQRQSEEAMYLVIRFWLMLFDEWISSSDKKLQDVSMDIYESFLTAPKLPVNVQKVLGEALIQIWQRRDDFAQQETDPPPSARMGLFRLLQSSGLEVKLFLADKLPAVFGFFTPANHDLLFDDLQVKLPNESEWTEGIAVRIKILAELGATWKSLLRKSVWYILEAAASVDSSKTFAADAIECLRKAHAFESKQTVFQLFSSQMVFTWQCNHSIAAIPFEIFGYESASEFFNDNIAEVTAQCFLFGKEGDLAILQRQLAVDEAELVRRSFIVTLTYAFARDTSENSQAAEQRLRQLLGDKEYIALIRRSLPSMLSRLLLCTDVDASAERTLKKKAHQDGAVHALTSMLQFAADSRPPVGALEPYFKTKYLLDGLERMGRRIGFKHFADIVQCPIFVVMCRNVLDCINACLGSLHTRGIIRKLRLLCALGHEAIQNRYAAEMLIRHLLPLVDDPYCADDTIGILFYAFERGRDSMSANVSGLACSVFSTIITLEVGSNKPKDVFTINSQSQYTRDNTRKLQDWLGTYANQLQDKLHEKQKSRYLDMAKACQQLRYPFEFRKESSATVFLLRMLEDRVSSTPILETGDRQLLVKLLVENSSGAPAEDDCLQDPYVASRWAPRIWTLVSANVSTSKLDDGVLGWLGRSLGLAYSVSGPELANKLLKPLEDGRDARLEDLQGGVSNSRALIVRQLLVQITGQDLAHASCAESTLRYVIDSFDSKGQSVALEPLVPLHVREALRLPSEISSGQSFRSLHQDNDVHDPEHSSAAEIWCSGVARHLAGGSHTEPIMGPLLDILGRARSFGKVLLPPVCHLALCQADEDGTQTRAWLSDACRSVLKGEPSSTKARAVLDVLVYLLKQPVGKETIRTQRLEWLDMDYILAARAAISCSLPKVALFLMEIAPRTAPVVPKSRRASSQATSEPVSLPTDLLMSVFDAIDDPDSFYAVERATTMDSVLQRLDREDDHLKSLLIHSACLDAAQASNQEPQMDHASSALTMLSAMNLNSITKSLLAASSQADRSDMRTATRSAQRLYDWDVQLPTSCTAPDALLFGAFQDLQNAATGAAFQLDLGPRISRTVSQLADASSTSTSITSALHSLSIMESMGSLTKCSTVDGFNDLQETLCRLERDWDTGQHDELMNLISDRETMFGILRRNSALQSAMRLSFVDTLLLEVNAVLHASQASCELGRKAGSLNSATYLATIMQRCEEQNLHVEVAVRKEMAMVLWKQNEAEISVQILRELTTADNANQAVTVGRAGLLSQLGHEIAEARLERPDEIIKNYLTPSLKALTKSSTHEEQASVYHQFATFCDQQLSNTENKKELENVKKMREQKAQEYDEYHKMFKSAPNQEKKAQYRREIRRAKQWYDLDNAEYMRLATAREDFVVESLANYLKALTKSDKYNSSVVRFFALWLENDESKHANEAVASNLKQVASWKFVSLLNQIMSRLLAADTIFQRSLASLVGRICAEHPHHSIYHLFATSNSNVGPSDSTGRLRKEAATKVAESLKSNEKTGELISKVWEANSLYHNLAGAKTENLRTKPNLRSLPAAQKMDQRVRELNIPPATLQLDIRPRADYRNVPTILRFRDEIAIASGLSQPKVLTARCSDGHSYKQLFKGGNDDLRQDAIMEQVFGSVSSMLRNHTATRRRNLHIRTYMVIPLSSTSGIIEFVPNSLPLGDYVVPAHARYHPSDMTNNKARETIKAAQEGSREERVRAFRAVTARYSPVLRHFFFERYERPDVWFSRRLAYARSTAAISVLGHVLGLGDRHCHNILLDELTGEVVHIDLGVAFEAGRVLPVPEVVPFRLTRDVVDGLGVTGIEGVFRRCCEFVLEALRDESPGIMTLLDVLRYDPLYSWTVSPLRARRMQAAAAAAAAAQEEVEEEGAAAGENNGAGGGAAGAAPRKGSVKVEATSEAERALSVVEAKLGKGLSVKAAVRELIQQAVDDKNLAVLFCGWSAYS